jgi:hypothetical protein
VVPRASLIALPRLGPCTDSVRTVARGGRLPPMAVPRLLVALSLLALGSLPGLSVLERVRGPAEPAAPTVDAVATLMPAWRAAAPPVGGTDLPAHVHAADLAATLSAWLPARGSVASLAPRETRPGTSGLVTRIHAGWGSLLLVALGVAIAIRPLPPGAAGRRRTRSPRGPPARA